MKTISRKDAISIYSALGAISLGHFAEETLDSVINNLNACRKVNDEMQKLNEELIKRLYADVDEQKKNECFELLGKLDAIRAKAYKTTDEAKAALAEVKDITSKLEGEYADIMEIYAKHNKVYANLLAKEVEVEIEELDADVFTKGVLKGSKDVAVHEIRATFSAMLKAEEQKDADFSELDELLK